MSPPAFSHHHVGVGNGDCKAQEIALIVLVPLVVQVAMLPLAQRRQRVDTGQHFDARTHCLWRVIKRGVLKEQAIGIGMCVQARRVDLVRQRLDLVCDDQIP